MRINCNGSRFQLEIEYLNRSRQFVQAEEKNGVFYGDGISINFTLKQNGGKMDYTVSFAADYESALRVRVTAEEKTGYHLIPCNIFGDNNRNQFRANEMPSLTCRKEGISDSEYWEFRADRAALPVSMFTYDNLALGISVSPYDGEIRNGVFAQLPNSFGITLGYTNAPVTFKNKKAFEPSTCHRAKQIRAQGSIFAESGEGRLSVHKIIRSVYSDFREITPFTGTVQDACRALVRCFNEINWNEAYQQYSNMECEVPDRPELASWRPLLEIGWTGGSVIAYPFLKAKHGLGLDSSWFKKQPEQMLDEIADCYNEASGMFYDMTDSADQYQKKTSCTDSAVTAGYKPDSSRVNGWWSGFGLAKDRHCAYTNGHACYYLLKACGILSSEKWKEAALRVLDTVMSLQREDGALGYTFFTDRKEVDSFDGFAGCWFVPALALAWKYTENPAYLSCADKALEFYHQSVARVQCCGTPMDTWRAVDQEGNIGFVKGAVLLHQLTQNEKYLRYAVDGADYEYLWRYGFRAKPELPPLKDSIFNSCGGSVTSVSNPHIHPMGVLLNEDLRYIGQQTGDSYHLQRAEDGKQFAMNILSLYPDVSGYGAYGVLTERYCPSDGLTTDTFSNGEKASMWFSYNGWAAANVLESLLAELQMR